MRKKEIPLSTRGRGRGGSEANIRKECGANDIPIRK